MRIAVTGASGRLGRALVAALQEAPFAGPSGPRAWSRPDFDLDAPERFAALLDRDRVECVVHAAAWTDVDGCARDPDRAMRRNGEATGRLATACAQRGADLILVSTNEVFDGGRSDGLGYTTRDAPRPANAYGASKLAGETAAAEAFTARASGDGAAHATGVGYRGPGGPRLGIVRTSWLFGPPGNDFPAKILAAADRAEAAGEPLRVVGDEYGSPTYTVDVAEAIVELLGSGDVAGVHHVVNAGVVSRAGWARELLLQARRDVTVADVPGSTWQRASTPPAWAVLEPTPLPSGETLRAWQLALADYLPTLLRQRASAGGPGTAR